MKHVEIANELNIPKARDYEDKKEIEAVRELYNQGREILKRALGDDGWRKQAEFMIAELKWWDSLSAEDKEKDRRLRSVIPATGEVARRYRDYYKWWVENTRERTS